VLPVVPTTLQYVLPVVPAPLQSILPVMIQYTYNCRQKSKNFDQQKVNYMPLQLLAEVEKAFAAIPGVKLTAITRTTERGRRAQYGWQAKSLTVLNLQ
jgi:hypothetical protein